MDETRRSDVERSAEEVAWDAEFSDRRESDATEVLGDLLKLAVSVPVAIVQMPMNLLPEETARHTRAAAREGFLAVRSLLSAVGDGIEGMLAEPTDRQTSTVGGPPGTWGTGRQSSPLSSGPLSSGKLRRIEVSEEPSTSGDEPEPGEGRGLRADIEY